MQWLYGQSEDTQDALVALHFSMQQVLTMLHRPFGLQGIYQDDESSNAGSKYARVLSGIEQEAIDQVDQVEERGEMFLFHYLFTIWGLDSFLSDVLLICLAPALDLRYQKLYGYLLDDMTRTRPTPNMILDLLVEPGPQRLEYLHYFADESPLFKHRLIQRSAEPGLHDPSLLNQPLAIDPTLVHWVLGVYEPAAAIRDFVTFENEPVGETELLTAEQQATLTQASGEAVLVFYGHDALAQQSAARQWAQQQERALLTLNLARAVKSGMTAQEAVAWLLRDALLVAAVAQITHWDACLGDDAPPAELLAMINEHPGPVILAGASCWYARQRQHSRPLHWLEFTEPDAAQRRQLLAYFLGDAPVPEALALDTLANQFRLTSGQLRDLVNSAVDQAVQVGRPVQNADLFAAARQHSHTKLATLARKITPRYSLADIVLPPDQRLRLQELIGKVRQRTFVLETWGVGQKLATPGLSALFAGKPGTGKTMAAEVMAHELQMDVYKIELSSMVSKYIGETEKNLERIFSEAERSNAILFFDEADAIFGKRGEVKDAHDRFANIEVSYLLQRMEAYNGVTILATNLRANLDEAFTRRFDTIIDFPFPEEAERLRIWQTLLPPKVPVEPNLDLARLARSFKLPGGHIRNIIVDAAYRAASDGKVVTMAHLLQSTRREVQKLGWLVNEKDFQ
ncbi:MAG: ATP-binding protein [Caldilineaceae bacterium]